MSQALIIQFDGEAGTGKSTILAGFPRPRRVLDTDVDGWRWLKEHADKYESTRNLKEAGRILSRWSEEKDGGSILIDTYSFGWEQVANQVMDDKERDPKFDTHRAWGPAKRAVRVNLHFPIEIAKSNGIMVGLTAHTKPNIKREGGKVIDEGFKASSDSAVNRLLDLWFRIFKGPQTGIRWVEVVKCRPQENWKPKIPERSKIEIGEYESHLLFGRIVDMLGSLPESTKSNGGDEQAEDKDAQEAMRLASQTYRKQ